MKKSLLSLVMLLALSFSASSQLLLNSGDSYSYAFAGLPTVGWVALPSCNAYTKVTLGLAPSTFNEGDSLQIELRLLSGGLFGSSTISSSMQSPEADFGYGGPLWVPAVGYSGEVRVTMLSGSAVLETVALNLGFAFCDEYEPPQRTGVGAVVAVPEPSTVSLAAVVGVAVLGWRLRRSRGGR